MGDGLSDDGVVNGPSAIAIGVDNLPVVTYSAYDTIQNDMDVVAKILSPCAVNVFKPDCRFGSRTREVRWAAWWGRQDVTWAPVVYDTRADVRSREFWIIQEYFPQIGWPAPDHLEAKKTFHPEHGRSTVEASTRAERLPPHRWGSRCSPHLPPLAPLWQN